VRSAETEAGAEAAADGLAPGGYHFARLALGQRPSAEFYQPSSRRLGEQDKPLAYPPDQPVPDQPFTLDRRTV
jgi:hypothetical protein